MSAEFGVVKLVPGDCTDDIHDETNAVGLAMAETEEVEAEDKLAGARLRDVDV